MPEFTCQVAGCCQAFDALEDYEHHYHTLHGNVCSSCKRAFPSGHLLDTHILEWHDSLFQILAERQDMVRDARPRRPGAAITGLVPEPCASRCQRLGSRLGAAAVPGSGWRHCLCCSTSAWWRAARRSSGPAETGRSTW